MKLVLAINMENLMSLPFLFVHTFIFSFPHMCLTVKSRCSIFIHFFKNSSVAVYSITEIIVGNRILG